jgi:ubiquitin C-terminal hydrolase
VFTRLECIFVKNYTRGECKQNYTRNECKEFEFFSFQATKQLELWKLPEVLIIHLKRFQHTETIRNKIDSLVRFPHLENDFLDLSPFLSSSPSQPSNFELFAVSDHSGSLVSGHYTAVAKNIDVTGAEGEEGKVKKYIFYLFYIFHGENFNFTFQLRMSFSDNNFLNSPL